MKEQRTDEPMVFVVLKISFSKQSNRVVEPVIDRVVYESLIPDLVTDYLITCLLLCTTFDTSIIPSVDWVSDCDNLQYYRYFHTVDEIRLVKVVLL